MFSIYSFSDKYNRTDVSLIYCRQKIPLKVSF